MTYFDIILVVIFLGGVYLLIKHILTMPYYPTCPTCRKPITDIDEAKLVERNGDCYMAHLPCAEAEDSENWQRLQRKE